jgi:hypothetical protein
MPRLKHALKEWSVAINALTQGQTILLLRKGGIREQGGKFAVPYSQVLLYPTYEHQTQSLLKSPYQSHRPPAIADRPPDSVTLQAWAMIDWVFQVTEADQVAALLPYHIWTERFVTERLRWKMQQPLYVLLLRVYRLANAVQLTWQAAYGGCRSWIELQNSLEISQADPALDQARYQAQVQQIQAILEPEKSIVRLSREPANLSRPNLHYTIH